MLTNLHKLNSLKGLILGTLLLGLFLILDGTLCIFKRITGLPCPSCGMTRAFISLINGDINLAFTFHPLWPLVLIIPIIILLHYYPKQKPVIGKRVYNILLGILLFLIIAVYLYRMYLYFPYIAPMDYNPNNLINSIWSIFR